MALLLSEILKVHDELLEKYRDPRVDDWPLMNSFWQPCAIIVLYLYFVFVWGPKWMEKRQPFNLDRILLVYNAVQVLFCFSLVTVASIYLVPYYSLRCEPVDYSNSFRGLLAAKLAWFCFLSKVLDLLDTVFFVLRKKNNQITFLHVYHHAGMIVFGWYATKFLPGGVSAYVAYINTIVHIFMYSYYFLTVYKKGLSRNIWLKKQMTRLQLLPVTGLPLIIAAIWVANTSYVQSAHRLYHGALEAIVLLSFIIFQRQLFTRDSSVYNYFTLCELQFGLISISFAVVVLTEDCGYPKWFCMLGFAQNVIIFYLFGDFYYKTYIRKKVSRNAPTKMD